MMFYMFSLSVFVFIVYQSRAGGGLGLCTGVIIGLLCAIASFHGARLLLLKVPIRLGWYEKSKETASPNSFLGVLRYAVFLLLILLVCLWYLICAYGGSFLTNYVSKLLKLAVG